MRSTYPYFSVLFQTGTQVGASENAILPILTNSNLLFAQRLFIINMSELIVLWKLLIFSAYKHCEAKVF